MTGAEPDTLVVMSWGGPWDSALRTAISDPFTKATGVRVRHAIHIGLELPEQLRVSCRVGARPQFDVVWCNAVAALEAKRNGWCDPLPETPTLRRLHPRARPPGCAGWPLVLCYAVCYVLVYQRTLFPHGAPTSWRALLDRRHRGRVALYPDGNGIHAVAQVLAGGSVADIPDDMAACWRFLRELRPQLHSVAYSGGLVDLLRAGELDMCFRALPNAIGFQAAGLDVDWVAPAEGVPDTMDALWVPTGLPAATAALAKRYVDFAMTASRQEHWCGLLGVLPVQRDSAVPAVLRARPDVPTSLDDRARLLFVGDDVKLAHRDRWRAEFAAIMASG